MTANQPDAALETADASIDRYFPTEQWLERYGEALQADDDLAESGEGWGVDWEGAMVFAIEDVPVEGRTVEDLPDELTALLVEEVRSYDDAEIEELLESAPEAVRERVDSRSGDLESRVVDEILETELRAGPDRLWPELRAELPPIFGALLEQLETHLGSDDSVYAWLDLHDGGCRGTAVVDDPDDRDHGFVITGAYEQWRGLVTGEDDVVNLIMSGEVDVDGDMQKLMQNAAAATDMVDVAADLDSRFLF